MITIENKEKLIEFVKENKLVILLFSATWCGPCKKLKEQLIEDKEVLRGFQVGYCDIDDENLEELVDIYKISSIPTIIFLSLQKNDIVEIKRIVGYDWIGLEMFINSLIKKDY